MPARSIPWPRILAEGFAIVVSILLAFGIQAWWEGRQERAVEQLYLERLHTELDGARDVILGHHQRQVRTIAAMDTLLGMGAEARANAGVELARTILNGASYGLTSNSVLFDQTYDEMLATGSLGLIRDPSLREAITGYYRLARSIATQAERQNADRSGAWAEQVRTAMGTQSRRWFSNTPARLDSSSAGSALQPTEQQTNRLIALVEADSGWADEVRRARGTVEGMETNLDDLLQATDSLIALLAEPITE